MTAVTMERPKPRQSLHDSLPDRSAPLGRITMYAIVFDLDMDSLQKNYGSTSYNTMQTSGNC